MAVLTEGDFSQRKCAIEDLKGLNSISRKFLVSSDFEQAPFLGSVPFVCEQSWISKVPSADQHRKVAASCTMQTAREALSFQGFEGTGVGPT